MTVPEDHAGLGVAGQLGLIGVGGADGLFGEAEIENADAAVAADHDVERFEVAMGDVGGMGGSHPVGNLDGEIEQFPHRQRTALEERGEGLAGDEFRNDVGRRPLRFRCRTDREYSGG